MTLVVQNAFKNSEKKSIYSLHWLKQTNKQTYYLNALLGIQNMGGMYGLKFAWNWYFFQDSDFLIFPQNIHPMTELSLVFQSPDTDLPNYIWYSLIQVFDARFTYYEVPNLPFIFF